MKKIRALGILSYFLFCTVFLSGCKLDMEAEVTQDNTTKTVQTADSIESGNTLLEDISIEDNDMLYVNDEDNSVVTMYLTVRQGNEEESTNHTWEEVNGHSVYYYEELGIDRYQVEGILQVGDENGPLEGELGYEMKVPNAIVSIRGQTSSTNAVKSYKIKLKDEKGKWREQQTINLNKHVYDGVLFRNKLCYDLLEELPGTISLRTQFVHLYVKDETESGTTEYEDYGLYTQVEQPNKTFLKNHGLDRYGHLYKINFFEFYQYEDVIKLKSDATYDEVAFNKQIEIKGDDDHTKLIAMLADVNDYEQPIEDVFGKWFDEDNLFSWMAFHILTGNIDTQSRNTLIYSPLNIEKWYFISWDNDGAFKRTEQVIKGSKAGSGWEYGVCNYWSNVLFLRMLKSDTYRQKLNDKIEEYRSILTQEKLEEMIAGYDTVTGKYRNQLPDIMYNRLTQEQYKQMCEIIPTEIEANYKLYLQSLEVPMPFYIGVPQEKDGKFRYNWDNSYDFDMENISYTFELARDYTFKEPIVKKEGIVLPDFETDKLEPGQYFIRVTSENESGFKQFAFDYYVVDSGKIFGVRCFYVLEDGSIEVDVNEEGD